MSSNFSVSEYVSLMTNISNQISFYVLIVIIPFGLFSNLISIYIFCKQKSNKKTNAAFLYICLSILNIISLLNIALVVRSINLFGYTINITCGIEIYVRRTIFNITSWTQVLICFDRFIFAVFPSRTKILSKKIYLFFIIFLIICLILITNCTNLIYYSETKINFNNKTNLTTVITTCIQTKQVSIATDFISILMRLYIPLFIMVALNLIVVKKLFKSKKKVKKNQTVSVHNSSKTNEHKFMISTITMDFIFWIFYVPVSINLTLSIINTFPGALDPPIAAAKYKFYVNCSQLVAFTYHSVIIFIQVTFNHYYRNEFFILFRIKKVLSILHFNSTTELHSTKTGRD